jgi:hypothetical protein
MWKFLINLMAGYKKPVNPEREGTVFCYLTKGIIENKEAMERRLTDYGFDLDGRVTITEIKEDALWSYEQEVVNDDVRREDD